MPRHFPFQLDRRFTFVWWPLGVRSDRDGVTVDEDTFEAAYGRFTVRTPLDNIASVTQSGPYNPLKAIGLRLSLADSGLTMGTSADGGVCVTFHEPVQRVIGLRDHRGLTVTVADPQGLVDALHTRGVVARDAE